MRCAAGVVLDAAAKHHAGRAGLRGGDRVIAVNGELEAQGQVCSTPEERAELSTSLVDNDDDDGFYDDDDSGRFAYWEVTAKHLEGSVIRSVYIYAGGTREEQKERLLGAKVKLFRGREVGDREKVGETKVISSGTPGVTIRMGDDCDPDASADEGFEAAPPFASKCMVEVAWGDDVVDVGAAAQDAHGALVLCAALECVDDTVLLGKSVLAELCDALPTLATTADATAILEAGRLVVPFGPSLTLTPAYYLVTAPGRSGRPEIQAFRDWLLAEVADFQARPDRPGT